MGVFDHFPYTNFHELNLEWILLALQEIQQTMKDFVSLNAIKYADPIQWDITRQYEKNTIVIDPFTGTAYISVRPVPSGANITDTDYWTVVFDLGQFVVKMAQNLAHVYEPETTLTATVASNYNDWIIWGDILYRNINPSGIIPGDQYVVGSNIEQFNIEDVIGHIQDLTTTDKSNLVAAINEVLQTLTDTCGDLDDLTTTDKSNLVAAINEVAAQVLGKIGDLDNLTTDDKSTLVAAINEVDAHIDQEIIDRTNADDVLEAMIRGKIAIDATNPPTGYTAMVADDDSIDNAPRLQALINDFSYIYIPSGTYAMASNIIFTHGNKMVFGDGESTILKIPDSVGAGKVEMFIIIPTVDDLKHITFARMLWDGNKVGRGNINDFAQQSFITCFTLNAYNVEDIRLESLTMINSVGFVALFAGHADGTDMSQYITRGISINNCCWYDNEGYIGTSGAESVVINNCRAYHNGRENLCFDNNSLHCKLTNSYIGGSAGGIGSMGIGTCTDAVVENCQFNYENTGTATPKYQNAISISNSFGASMTVDIHDCTIRNCPNCGIFFEYDPAKNTTTSGNLKNIIFKNCGKSIISEIPFDKGVIKASLLFGAYEIDNQQSGNIIFDTLHGIWSGTANSYVYTGADMRSTFTTGNYHRMGVLDSYNEPKILQSGFYHLHYEADLAWAGSTPADISDNKQFKLMILVNGVVVASDQHYSYLDGHYDATADIYCGKGDQLEFFITDFDNTSPLMQQSLASVEYIGTLDPYITDLLF